MAGDLPPEALSERLARERKAERERVLRELGIEDPSKYKSEREELAKLRSEREKAERAKLTREQALQADLAKERAQRESIEAQLRESQTARVYDRQETQIQSIVGRHILPSRYKYARTDFIEYLSGLSKRQIARLTERDIDRWFARFAKDNPDFAIARPEEPPEETKPKSSTRKPVNSSPSAAKPAPPPAATNTDPSVVDGKTFRPGQPNSMNKHEVKQAMKRLGLRGW
jgi:phage terminase Nu1 subunit (DNA packaging protein)